MAPGTIDHNGRISESRTVPSAWKLVKDRGRPLTNEETPHVDQGDSQDGHKQDRTSSVLISNQPIGHLYK